MISYLEELELKNLKNQMDDIYYSKNSFFLICPKSLFRLL